MEFLWVLQFLPIFQNIPVGGLARVKRLLLFCKGESECPNQSVFLDHTQCSWDKS